MKLLLGVFILVVAAAAQTVGAGLLAGAGISVDFLLVCAVSCGMIAGEGVAVAVAVCAGVFRDAFSAGAFGDSVAAFVPVSLLISCIRHRIWAVHWTRQAACGFAGTIAAWLVTALIARLKGGPGEAEFGFVFKTAVCNACITPPAFRVWQAVFRG